jgi:FtsH ternary system domain X5
MSRAYRISIKEALNRHVQVEDGIRSSLELLPILEKERMAELLAEALVQRGFRRENDKVLRDEKPGIVTEIDLRTGEVNVVAQGHLDLSLVAERNAIGDTDRVGEGEARLKAAAQEQLERQASLEEEKLRQTVSGTLEETLKGLKGELDDVVNRVTASALKARAAQLGTIEEMHEEENGSLTIKVRV